MSNQNLKLRSNTYIEKHHTSWSRDFEHLNVAPWLCAFIDGAGPIRHNPSELDCNDATRMYQTYTGWISLAYVTISFGEGFFVLWLMTGILYECVFNRKCPCDKSCGVSLNASEEVGQKSNVRKHEMTSRDASEEEKGQISLVGLRYDNENKIREKCFVEFILNVFWSNRWTDPTFLLFTIQNLCIYWFCSIIACVLISFVVSKALDRLSRKS
ncbi:uncharacterized protein EAF01_002204 [Botrytis porri]|uniref:uncharacterized protein n=1 Tax=Botrytis porri TaxID=87229 RepID=UPI001900C569|nr:uncharacterized protein EAF01_002204 [Botrytis porri]KAF7910694.1 hypothetical protein EAF01_002204 [Botrytis porri]